MKKSPMPPMTPGTTVRVEPISNGFLTHHTPPGMGPTVTRFHNSNPMKASVMAPTMPAAPPMAPKAPMMPKAMPMAPKMPKGKGK